MENLMYPIGRFEFEELAAVNNLDETLSILNELPYILENKVNDLVESDLEKPYRAGGWTVRQVVHHLADSHMNMLIRVKSALTQTESPIMGYDEATWATFSDNQLPLEVSVQLLKSIHAKVYHLFTHMKTEDWTRTYYHTGDKRFYTLLEVATLYAWHSAHHLAHIEIAVSN